MTSATQVHEHGSPAWQEVRDLITERRTRSLADRVLALTEAERTEVARLLPGLLTELREAAARRARESWRAGNDLDDDEASWPESARNNLDLLIEFDVREELEQLAGPLRVAGAGTISGPAATVAWLTRRELRPRQRTPSDTEHLVRVLTARPAAWHADVTTRLAGKIRTAADPGAPLVLALLRAGGIEPPPHDPLVVAWVSSPVVTSDPLVTTLLPRIFEAQGVGRALREERLTPAPTRWLGLIRRLLASGRLSRDQFLDGCVSRFLRGGDAADLRFFVRLHTLLDPAPAEAATRARDYLRLLPAAPGTVAELALAQVRRTGPHDSADVAEAIGVLVFRAEAKLARAGLSWLDERVRRSPATADELAPALATAFAHTSYEVQSRAVQLALKHAARFEKGTALIAEAVPSLPVDLGARVAAVFGGDTTEAPAPFAPPPLPPVEAVGRFSGPTAALGTLSWDTHDWATVERWLAGFVALAADDRTALREQLAPVFGDRRPSLYAAARWLDPSQWVVALAQEAITPGADPGVPDPEPVSTWAGSSFSVRVMPDPAVEFRRRNRLPDPHSVSPPHLFLLHRLCELYRAFRAGTLPPVLLATPTLMSGSLDPEVLVDRLEACAAVGCDPLSADLQQALLRLPRGTHPEAAERAGRVASHAAATVASWLAEGGLPDPEAGFTWGYLEGAGGYLFDEREPAHDGRHREVRPVPVLRAEPTGHPLIDELLRKPAPWRRGDHGRAMAWWPAILPSHREVVSVNYLPHLLNQWSAPSVDPAYLAMLAEADGPLGDATALILATFLAGRDQEAVPLLVRMAARGGLPTGALGRQLGLLIRRTWFETRPVLASLSEAARQGAQAQVWEILMGLLPVLLPGEGERPTVTHAEAVALAADVALWSGARGEIAAVSAHAASGRNSRFARECARLRDRLAGHGASAG
ncbi:DUF6493 family protein [Nonomuraea dietziae]|uniref:DUF6493 family protein n=1 Tax=Nonomuraea dietziae TaxID=65515 RepID=UPI0033FDE6F0